MTRGGSREGSGRKAQISGLQALQVGGYCEALWEQAAVDQALARYEALPSTKDIRAEQSRTDLIPPPIRRRARGALSDITESIDEITGGARRVTLPILRPYGAKEEIITKAVTWCQEQFGRPISRSKAVECWKQFKRFQRSPGYRALKST